MIQILKYGDVPASEIFARTEPSFNVEDIVADIIANVRQNGDAALYEYCEKFDKAKLSCLLVSKEEIEDAVAAVEPRFLEILRKAAENIRAFHSRQVRNSFVIKRLFLWTGQACMCLAAQQPTLPRCRWIPSRQKLPVLRKWSW